MAEQLEPQDRSDDAASPVPNRRERRGMKSGTQASRNGKSAMASRSAPALPARHYSTRRRSG